MVVILENIRSVYNVGSMFRTADGAGVGKLYLCGFTPTPLDKLGKPRRKMSKVALGATDFVDWEEKESAIDTIKELKGDDWKIFAVEEYPDSVPYNEFDCSDLDLDKLALVVGHEVDGISEEVLSLCDKVIEIPMQGEKRSLNVSVALGIVSFYFANFCDNNRTRS